VTHKDSLGNEGRTEAGDVQVMSAGTGIRHAEYNVEQQPTRIFQTWVTRSFSGRRPAWGSQPFPKADRSGQFVRLASGFDNDNDALPIRAPARVLGATLKVGRPSNMRLAIDVMAISCLQQARSRVGRRHPAEDHQGEDHVVANAVAEGGAAAPVPVWPLAIANG
jgi:hypothetical protein